MNVTLDYQPNCVVALEIALPADRVSEEWNSVTKEFQTKSRLPGYRPGKAPIPLIASRFAKEIAERVEEKLVQSALNEAIKLHKIPVISVSIRKAVIAPDRTMKIQALVIHDPQFDLPDYKTLTIEVAKQAVTEEDVNSLFDYLRDPHAKYEVIVGRPAAMGDYAVVNYEGTVDGLPLTEVAPQAPAQLQTRRNAWVFLHEGTLLPGFAAAIAGMEPGQERTFTLDVPEGFPVPELVKRQVTYTVTLHAINIRTLPPLDDELAAKIDPGHTLETLRQKIRERLETSNAYQFSTAKNNAVAEKLLSLFTCELPESLVASETTTILKTIVAESQARGLSDEAIKAHTEQTYPHAQQIARDHVQLRFLFLSIAEKEALEIPEAEMYQALLAIAEKDKLPIKKLVADLHRNGGITRLREQLLINKALDLVASGATVVEPAATPVAQA